MEEIKISDNEELLAAYKETSDLLDRTTRRCYDKNGNDVTDKYTRIAELLPADKDGIKEYRGVKYHKVDNGWQEYNAYDLVLIWPTEEKLLSVLDKHANTRDLAKKYLKECNNDYTKAYLKASRELFIK